MKIIITSLIIGVLFTFSEAGPYKCADGYVSNRYGLCEPSREPCRLGYYRAVGQCKACPCNNREKSCEIDGCSRVRCHCRAGYTGKYCQNDGSYLPKNETLLKVVVKPITQTVHRDFDGINVACIVNDSNVQVMWLRNGTVYTDQHGQRVGINFSIDEARDSDGGSYICLAMKGRKCFKAVASIKVVEVTAPVAKITPITDGKIKIPLGERFELICNAVGFRSRAIWKRIPAGADVHEIIRTNITSEVYHQITSMSKEQAGKYVCSAENPWGSDLKTIEVEVEPLILEVYPGESQVVISGHSVSLDCRKPAAYRNIEVYWERGDNGRFTSNVIRSANGSLTITNITIDQAGKYRCVGANVATMASISVNIEVYTLPVIEIVSSTDESTIAKLGDLVKLECTGDGHPQPSVQWQKFSPDTESFQAVEPATLNSAVHKIESLSRSNAGLYLCSATNLAGSSNKSVRVVIEPPVLGVYPNDSHVVIAGSSITLDCNESAGYSDMKFVWSRDDNSSLPSNVNQSENGSFTITNIAINQEGRYKCSATNGLASAFITTEIEVRTLPVITIPKITDRNITKKIGDRIELKCEAEGHPQPSVQWQKVSPKNESSQVVKPATLNSEVYEISSLLTSEAGLYLCSAMNPAGSSNKTVRVVIKQPILEIYPNDSHVVLAGSSITLKCHESAGYSDMKFTWSREDNSSFPSNVHPSENGSLTITDIAINQEGGYKCSATNGLASASITTEIEVRTLPVITIPKITDGNITKKIGDRVELKCEAEGHPQPSVQWQKFSPKNEFFQVVKPATLNSAVYEISSLLTSEAGLYLCFAKNLAGSSNKSVRVVIEPPVLGVYPNDSHVVIAGSSITLECNESAGYSDMKFVWSRDDNSSLPSNVNQSENGSFTITNIAINQEGRYKCTATNGLASAFITTEIEVRTLPVITIPKITDGNITKKIGDRVELKCEAEGHPQPSVQWQKFSPKNESFQVVKPATLNSAVYEISSLLTSEAGLYLCSAMNPAGCSNKTVRVVIKQPILEIYPNDSHVVLAGSSITLKCHESAGYSDMKFTWSREDNSSFPSNVHPSENGSLTITDIAINQEGGYKCSATNGLASASITTEIEVRTLPVITIQKITDGNITKKIGDRVELKCEAEGHPQPSVQWQKFSPKNESFQVVKPATLNSAVYEISSLLTSEAGLYLCFAKNLAGSSNKSVQVVIEPPVLGVYPNDSHVVIAGSSIALKCNESAGYSDMKFLWSRDDNSSLPSNVNQSENGSFTITNIAIDQEGRYKCTATNGLASAFITTGIEVRTVPVITIPKITDGNITKKIGDRVELKCEAEGHPQPSVQWQKFSPKNESFQVVKPATLNSAVYEISSLLTSEAGLYLCSAMNPAGCSNKTVRVVIKQPILEIYPNDSHVVLAGSSITLKCHESAGYSDMKFTWSREDNSSFPSNVHPSENGSLTITDIAINQEGGYKCSATNGLASASITTEIEVRTLPVITIQKITDGNITKKIGDRVELKCEAEGHPQPSVQWQKFSPKNESFQVVKPATLNSAVYEISSLLTSEAGLYLCFAKNLAGSSNKSVQVVIEPPVLGVYPNDSHVVIAGSSIALKCNESAGYSDMKFLWSRDDNSSLPSNVNQSENGSFTITNIAIDQEGRYKCTATNGLASAFITTGIEVRTVPVITIPKITDGNITKKIGDRVELKCGAEGHPQPSVQWQKFSPKNESFQVVKPATLNSAVYEISSLLTSEAGLYLCSAMNPAGSSNKTLRVVIKQPILEIYPNDSHVVLAGSSITLKCHESAGYSDMKFTWSREDNSSFPSNVHPSENGSLTITDIAINQEGGYKCSATNGLASASITTEIEVRTVPVITIPKITDGNITKKIGDRVELKCEAEGHPQPSVQWQKFSPKNESFQFVKPATLNSAVYEISSLLTSEAGLYLCSAMNPAGSSNKTVRVVIKQPILEIYPNDSHVVLAGSSITLKCHESAGYSDMKFTWSREDNSSFPSNVHPSENGFLTITDIAINQEGGYKCSATNGLASAFITTEIEVRTVPIITIPKITDGNITKKIGDRVELKCEAEGHPQPSVQWQKFSPKNESFQVVKPATLNSAVYEISSLLTSEAGLYLCFAKNLAGSSNKSVRVGIEPPVLGVYPNDSHVVIAGSSITLECNEYAGYSNMKFTWSREENSSFPSNVHPSENGSLTITDIAINQEGGYKCSATNGLASVSITTDIEVRTLPVITIPKITDGNITKKIGDRVELKCGAEGHPQPSVQWQKFSPKNESFQVVKPATLNSAVYEISSLLTSEAGLYLCSAMNPAGSSNKTLRVVIKQPILEIYPNDSHVVLAGGSITLKCHESAGYSDMKFTWSREDNSSFPSNVHPSENGSLTITDIAINQEGGYKCSATNGLASASITTEIEVRTVPVITIPKITDGNITKKIGDRVELKCEAEGHPQPSVQWQKFSPKNESFQFVKPATLNSAVYEISSLLTSEAGLYLCSAMNPAGSSNKTVRVVIKQPILEIYPNDSHVVLTGSSITLKCHESAGYSDMKFTWSREDNSSFPSNVHPSENGFLTITDIAINQEGGYKCSATNGLASVLITTEIEVRTVPVITIPKITDGNITKKIGDRVELKCEAEGHPQPSVQWQKFSPKNESFQVVKPATLNSAVYEISSLLTSEAGLYLCFAKNLAGSSNKSVRVGIEPPVLGVYPNDSHVVIAGSSITLECNESAGYSDMKFVWSSNNNSSFPSNVHPSENGSLTITDIAINQEGGYKCSATNGLASVSITTDIEVRTLPVITIPKITDGNITKKIGDRVELKCGAEGHPQPSVQWQKFSPKNESFQVVKPATLNSAVYEISSLLTSEAGLYLCFAQNLAGSSNKSVRVVIEPPVLGVYPNDSHVVIAGSSITLECNESAGYSDMKFVWSRDDNSSLPSNVNQSENGSFAITNIAINQEGRYKCSATNGLASAFITTEIEVRTVPVITIPKITDGDITKKIGDRVELKCEAEGHPQPSVQWQKFSSKNESFQIVKPATLNSTVYEISSLLTSEAGLYLCFAKNLAGSSNKSVRVGIEPPVLGLYPNDSHVVIAGSSITLECNESAGYSDMKFTWSREDNSSFPSNVHPSENGSLTITDIAINQEGGYKCSATNGLASVSITTDIEVRTLPVITIPKITDGNITKKIGDRVELKCGAEGHPQPSVQWQKFSPKNESFQVVKPATLNSAVYEISSLVTSEAGLYLCFANNLAGSSNKSVRVVIEPPVLGVYPNDSHVVIAGSSITLECNESAGYSDMKFVWSRNNNSSLPSNVNQSENGSLTITNTAINQEGRYKCSATNGLASAFITTGIEVRTLPVITIPKITDGNITKKMGDRVELKCEAEGHPQPSVQWQKFSPKNESFQFVKPATLNSAVYEISSLLTSEAGLYLCSAMNPAGSSNKTVRVVIKQPILEIYPNDSHVVLAGSSITLKCHESAGYSDMKFTWSREDNSSFPSNVHPSENGSLTITDIAINQEGGYKCSATNGLASASITTEIEVRTLPVITIPKITDGNITKKIGDRVELKCEAEGHPQPSVQWQKFSPKNESSQVVKPATLNSAVYEISSLLTSEAGLYLCFAKNLAGSSNKSVRVGIEPPVLGVSPNDSHVVIAGSSITLECNESAGYSDMKFVWSRDDNSSLPSNVNQSENGSFAITNIAINQEGRYKCSATNGLASAFITTEIEVRTVPVITIPKITDGNITKKMGDRVELKCEAEGHPQPSVQWQKFSPKNESFQFVKPATLNSAVYEISSLLTSEAGLYLCSAMNPAGSSNKTVRVVIKQPILEIYPNDSHVVIAGSSITLECNESAGYSDMKFTWSREDNSSFPSNVHPSENGSLTITDIAINQEGGYKCSATNGLASVSITTDIEVRTLPVITIPKITDGNITKKIGDRVELKCGAEGHPQPSVQWQKFSPKNESFQVVKPATLNSAVYEISSLVTSEAGLYLCFANNLAGSSNKSVRVVIEPPVLGVYPNDSHVVIAGSSITLECNESAGYSDMKFVWSRNDNSSLPSNVNQSENGSLTITNIAINQEGRYKCSATNGLASAFITTGIEVRTVPVITIPKITDGNITKKIGDRVELKCEAEGHPQPSVQWQKFSPKNESFQVVKPATLNSAVYEISSLLTSEAGLYLCSAMNPAGSSNKTVRVVIKQPILEIYPNDSHVVIAGSSITLECNESAGYSDMKFTWSREDNSSFPSNVHPSENGSLTITDIAINQEGGYKCSATNGLASVSITTDIEVRTLPVITIPKITDGNITKKIGDRVELKCGAEGHPQPSVQWQKFSPKNESFQVVKPATLNSAVYEISSLVTSEAGLYLCFANNLAGSSNKSVRVVIEPPVLGVYPNDSHVVIAGSSITLECNESAGYSDMKFVWSRNDNSSLPSNVNQSENGSLTITNIAINQEGRYKCSATNGLASAFITTGIEVRTVPVITIPKITDGNITKKIGDRVELKCEAEGHPQPSVQWQKFSPKNESFQVVKPATLNSAVYEISSLLTSEAGLYLCSAMNPAGSSNKTVRVVIKQPILEIYPNDSHVVLAGSSITLKCHESVGYSDMQFTWSREDNSSFPSNVHPSENGSLTITDIAINQEGGYKCSATNGLASAFITTEIEVRTLPVITIPKITGEKITKKIGDRVELNCEAEGHPQPSVQWLKFSHKTKSFHTIKSATLISSAYEIVSSSREDAGTYLCSAANSAGSTTEIVRVVIRSPVLEVHPNVYQIVPSGRSITLQCRESAGFLNMEFDWMREDGKPLAPNVVKSLDGSLKIKNITINERGRYICSATNGKASSSAIAEIEVDLPPSDIKITRSYSLRFKLSVQMTCQANGERLSYNWTAEHGDLLDNEVVEESHLFVGVYSSKEKTDRMYCCKAFNTAGISKKCAGIPFHQIIYRSVITSSVGESVELICRVIGGEISNYHTKWKRIDESPLPSNAITVDHILRIPKVTKADAGTYNCVGSYIVDGHLWTFDKKICLIVNII